MTAAICITAGKLLDICANRLVQRIYHTKVSLRAYGNVLIRRYGVLRTVTSSYHNHDRRVYKVTLTLHNYSAAPHLLNSYSLVELLVFLLFAE